MAWPQSVDTFRVLHDYPGPPATATVDEIPTAADFNAIFAAIQHAQQAQLGPSQWNALQYGADPHGGTDALAALTQMVTDCYGAGGGLCTVPAGTYALSDTLIVPSTVRLQAPGAVLRRVGASRNPVLSFGWTGTPAAQDVAGVDVTVDGNNVAVRGIDFHSVQRGWFPRLVVKNVTDCGYGFLADGAAGTGDPAYGNVNTVFCDFGQLYCDNAPVGMRLVGASAGAAVTDNRFGLCVLWHVTVGVALTQWCDSHNFDSIHLGLHGAGAIGVQFSGSTSAWLGVYDEHIRFLTLDNLDGGSGQLGAQFNYQTKQCNVGAFYAGPGTWSGAPVQDNGAISFDLVDYTDKPGWPANAGMRYSKGPVIANPNGAGSGGGAQSWVGNGAGRFLVGDPGVGADFAGFSTTGTLDATHYTVAGSGGGDVYLNRAAGNQIYLREGNGPIQQMWWTGGVTELTGRALARRAVSANYTVALTDESLFVTAGAGGVTITLPTATGGPTIAGRVLTVKKVDSGAGAVHIISAGGTIDGAAAGTGISLANQYTVVRLQSDGTNWQILSKMGT